MAVIKTVTALAAIAVLSGAAALLFAQLPEPGATTSPAANRPTQEIRLEFDREIYSYPGGGRRDPFKPLVGKESLGPLFEDLKLKVIIYSPDPTRSVVLVQDGTGRSYRMRRGDVVGNSRLVEVRPLVARFAVENFGMIRYQTLDLRPGASDAAGVPRETAPTPATQPIQGAQAPKADTKRLVDSLNAARKTTTNNDEWPFQPEARR